MYLELKFQQKLHAFLSFYVYASSRMSRRHSYYTNIAQYFPDSTDPNKTLVKHSNFSIIFVDDIKLMCQLQQFVRENRIASPVRVYLYFEFVEFRRIREKNFFPGIFAFWKQLGRKCRPLSCFLEITKAIKDENAGSSWIGPTRIRKPRMPTPRLTSRRNITLINREVG